jgi:hypothetical protein
VSLTDEPSWSEPTLFGEAQLRMSACKESSSEAGHALRRERVKHNNQMPSRWRRACGRAACLKVFSTDVSCFEWSYFVVFLFHDIRKQK